MDQREPHDVRSLGICYRIYHFIMKTLASQALKTVTLGRSMQFDSTKVQTCREDEVVIKPETKDQKAEENSPGMNNNGGEKMVPLRKAPKKTVSINDNVEEIDDGKKRKKRIKSFQKSNSLDRQEEENEDVKPLRPILKVKSNLGEKSIS